MAGVWLPKNTCMMHGQPVFWSCIKILQERDADTLLSWLFRWTGVRADLVRVPGGTRVARFSLARGREGEVRSGICERDASPGGPSPGFVSRHFLCGRYSADGKADRPGALSGTGKEK
jgi:hypothetical protein